ncbi:hypothetical protein EDD33_1696 [Nocardioides aurantiacus]|uniref:Uncharacterized protein n=1 Tax=Nocardioides aurantiacus TaxID=86796 RepID=A0A3N2CTI3_9ACTN|nr:hypothetical protein EDD33_1696 [Nocardioides aurantiacus]
MGENAGIVTIEVVTGRAETPGSRDTDRGRLPATSGPPS